MPTGLARDRKTAVYKRKLYSNSMHSAILQKESESRPDFVAVKGLIEQHTVSYRSFLVPSAVLSNFFAYSFLLVRRPRPSTFPFALRLLGLF